MHKGAHHTIHPLRLQHHGLPELESRGITGVRGVFDDRFMVADDRWLAQLEDVPGAYLDERIRFEAKRRADAGLTPPAPEDPR